MTITPEYLDRMEALASKATKGPWAKHPAIAQVDSFEKGYPLPVCQFLWPTDDRSEAETEANEEFVAASREAVPAIIAEVRRIQAAQEWRAMDSAPRDGKHCILSVQEPGGFIYSVQGAYQNGQWNAVHRDNVEPLAWMPNRLLPRELHPTPPVQS